MLAVNYSTIRNNLKDYCDQATDNHETVIVTRKGEKNVVIMSLERYNQLEHLNYIISDASWQGAYFLYPFLGIATSQQEGA